MRSSITIFLIGLALGSTLGIGGLWTQVVEPAKQQIEELNAEHKIMEGALQEASQTIEEVAASLRDEAPTPVTGSNVTGGGTAPGTAAPASGEPRPKKRDNKFMAERLEKLAAKLKARKAE